eukprot:TRINITY_DN14251_c0_g1_i1.p1 TRINITY_DN14251_c0_g1~~TRINITY_DN14251_c0_g1_i1.p1  ORF type:complete len:605 (+),score=88.79 TRINITY_DN14251_c0_g1_i1:67-1881(+)
MLKISVVLLCVVLHLCLVSGQQYKRVGCYQDVFAAFDRDIGDFLLLDEAATPASCAAFCIQKGLKIFALQYGNECRCGPKYGRYGVAPDSDCSTPCAGDINIKCGGSLRNDIYEITSPVVAPPKSPVKLLAVVMIVKDEAHTLANTLIALKGFIDAYYILDTGSTDGTQDVIRRVFEGIPGEIYQEPFIDYGTSRNRILELAQNHKEPPVFSFMLSADETVYNAHMLRKFCEDHHHATGIGEEGYTIVMDLGWRFDSLRLSRTAAGYRYIGRVHEYLAAPGDAPRPVPIRIPVAYIKFRITDPERRQAREYITLNILLDEKSKHPEDGRTSFYLARTYQAVNNHTEALKEYRRRVSLGGWKEEVYESLYSIGWQLQALNRPWSEVQQAFLDAHAQSPERAEPLFVIAEHYSTLPDTKALAFLFAQRAAQLPYPKDCVLWVLGDVYKYKALMLLAQVAFDLREYERGAEALAKLNKVKPVDVNIELLWSQYQAVLGDRFEQIMNPNQGQGQGQGQGQDQGQGQGQAQSPSQANLNTNAAPAAGQTTQAASRVASPSVDPKPTSRPNSRGRSLVIISGFLAVAVLLIFVWRWRFAHDSMAHSDKMV